MKFDINTRENMFVIYGSLQDLRDIKTLLLSIQGGGYDYGWILEMKNSLTKDDKK